MVQAPALSESGSPKTADAILIKAEPSPMGDQCKFMVNRDLFEGYSWWFPDLASAEGSPLAEALFGLDEVETVLVHESTLTLTRKDKNQADWRPLAKQAGAAIRSVLQSGSPLIAEKIIRDMPSEDDIREEIQEVIDMVVNPGVAGHGGNVSLLGVKGNTVTIAMGGGCQGCSSASYTLKVGIHNAFRKAIPTVGAILDETDHAAGLNPYYS
ncbi:MAG: NifU family protein [Nitrospinales bacterium]